MHRLAASPGGWNPELEGVVFVEQSHAPLTLLTAADTDIQLLAKAVPHLPKGFPEWRVASLLQLQQHLTIDTYAEDVLRDTKVIVLRLLGGRAYWSYGLEVIKLTVEQTGAALVVLPGDDRPDPDLISHSSVPLSVVDRLWRYFTEGGIENTIRALQFIADACLGTAYNPAPAQVVPRVGVYEWAKGVDEGVGGWGDEQGEERRSQKSGARSQESGTIQPPKDAKTQSVPSHPPIHPSTPVGILFYRAHYLAGNTAPIDALCQALADRNLHPVPVFVSSLRDADVQAEVIACLQPQAGEVAQVLLNTTSFSLAKLAAETPSLELWQQLDVPVLQVICSGGPIEQWQAQTRGLSPRDIAINVVLPEVDGRIISRAVSFKAVQWRDQALEVDVVGYQPVPDRIEFVADLAANWVRLRQTPPAERKIALILANYPTRDGRIANGVGLDTPASCVEILKALQHQGYSVSDIPKTGDELIQRLTAGITNDSEGQAVRATAQSLPLSAYRQFFAGLPGAVQQGVGDRWGMRGDGGDGGGRGAIFSSPSSPSPHAFPISGIQFGNIFVGIQPARGYDRDPTLNYHAPDLEPTHEYLAFYHWVRHWFGAQAIVHVGKHGNLEWLPGKGVALSETCYPEVAIGPLPHLYPFIVNDPGEGAQAKRRSQAVILDHLTPPMTRAELYGPLQQLEGLIDEYYEAQNLDPTRLAMLRDRIVQLMQQESLQQEIVGRQKAESRGQKAEGKIQHPTSNIQNSLGSQTWADFLTQTDGYLCELKEAQIRDGLHIFGQCPQGRQLRDLIVAIARHPGLGRLGLTRAIARDWGLAIDPLTVDLAEPFRSQESGAGSQEIQSCRTVGDLVELLEKKAAQLVETLLTSPSLPPSFSPPSPPSTHPPIYPSTQTELTWITDRLLPALLQTNQEITYLLHGLAGGYVPSGASGAPTRGRPEVLPTGRNFYSVDIRAVPTESAWDVGRKAAETLIEQYVQENGEYPQTLALSIWGTSTMRTGGDDLAEALALLGVQPVWDGPSRRVVDFEIVPVALLGRPRVDVTLRISGFFRDAFPNLVDLFHQAVTAVAELDESPEQNPLADRVQQDTQTWQTAGLSIEQAIQRSSYRIFGSKPGAYGAGLQGLIEAQNWTDDADLARAYINWSSYAYTGQSEGRSAPEAFEQRLRHLQIVLHNQDNREHDLLDSDDYYQFQGGLTAAVRSLTGQNPQTYFGDHSRPENPQVRKLQEEIARVYRSRVINPKWIAGVMRHGYKGAFELSATVDYLFAYDATAGCVADYMYQGVAQAYLFDPQVQGFVQQKNPWSLRDMAERLLEANQRGLWQNVNTQTLEDLRAIVHQAEGAIEGKNA